MPGKFNGSLYCVRFDSFNWFHLKRLRCYVAYLRHSKREEICQFDLR